MLPLRSRNTHGPLSLGNAVQASHGLHSVAGTLPTYEPPRNAVHASLDEGVTAVSTTSTAYSADVNQHCSGASSESAAHLRRTITRLRVTINAVTATSTAFFPDILPALSAADATLDIAASYDLEASTTEQRRELRDSLWQLEDQLGSFALALSAFSPAVPSSQVVGQIAEFYGFENDADEWVATVNAIAMREAWTEPQKWSVAVDRLREGAAAWHRYEGFKQQSWAEWSSKLIAAFGRTLSDLPSTTQFNLTTTDDKAQDVFRLQAAAMRCSSPLELSDSLPSSDSSSVQSRTTIEDGPREGRHSNDLPTLNHPECAAVPCNSFDDLLAERSAGYTETGSKARVALPMPGSTPGPILRTSVPATNAIYKSEVSERTVDSKKTILDQSIPHLQSLAERVSYIDAFQAERANIGLSGNMMYDLADDDKHAILTPNVPPEHRADPHEVVAVTMEITPDYSGHHQLGQNRSDNSKEAAGTSHHDCVQWPVRAHTHPVLRKHFPAWHANAHKNHTTTLRLYKCLLGKQRLLQHIHCRSPNLYAELQRRKDRPPRHSQFHTPESSSTKVRVNTNAQRQKRHCDRPRQQLQSQRAKSQPRRVRPRRGSQCRPPEPFSPSLPSTSNLGRDRPQRQNSFHPSENALEASQRGRGYRPLQHKVVTQSRYRPRFTPNLSKPQRLHRHFERPRRDTQCRPPDLASRNFQSGRGRPQRCSQPRPPEALSAAPRARSHGRV